MPINDKSLISYAEEASTTAAAAVPASALTPASAAPTLSAATAAPCMVDPPHDRPRPTADPVGHALEEALALLA